MGFLDGAMGEGGMNDLCTELGTGCIIFYFYQL